MVVGRRISTITFEVDREEPVLGLRPGCDKFPVPKDSQDFAILSQEKLILGRQGATVDSVGRLELRKLDEWEPVPYAILPFVPPIRVDTSVSRALAHLPLIDGWESGLAVIDLDHFREITRLPFTGPFDFIPLGADCYEESLSPSPESSDALPFEVAAMQEAETEIRPVRTGIVATMPHDIANEELIAKQPYADALYKRITRARGGRSCRSPVILDYEANVLHRVQRETELAGHLIVPDKDSLYVITEENVFLRRISLDSGAIDWDLDIGRNQTGSVFSCHATAFGRTHLGDLIAIGVYDERIDIIDAQTGERVSQIWLHDEGRSRIVSLAWYPGGAMLAIGLVTGTVLFAWLPESFETAWRLRVFRVADRSLRKLQFHPMGDRLFTLSQDGYLRSWKLLDDERARLLATGEG